MSHFFRPAFVFCFIAAFVAGAHGQSLASAKANDWSQLQRLDLDALEKKARSGIVSNAPDFVARANALNDYLTAHPGDSTTSEARRLEALMLVYAAADGDNANNSRRDELVAAVRGDKTLPPGERFALALLADLQTSQDQFYAAAGDGLVLREKTLRNLVAEFPDAAASYETLLSFAKDCPEAQAAGIGRDLLRSEVSQTVKDGAQLLLDRVALIGSPIKSRIDSALAAKDRPSLSKNNLTILYPWSSTVTGTWAIAGEIAAKAPAGAAIIGVNLDQDLAAARQVAIDRKLPGLQLYDPAGPNSALARALKLACDNVVLIADSSGTIVSVSAGPDLAAKINAAAR